MTAPAPVDDTEVVESTGPDETLVHWFCACEPNVAYCGWDVSGFEEIEPDEASDGELCVVCVDYQACPRCGDPR